VDWIVCGAERHRTPPTERHQRAGGYFTLLRSYSISSSTPAEFPLYEGDLNLPHPVSEDTNLRRNHTFIPPAGNLQPTLTHTPTPPKMSSSPSPERITITICGDGGCGKSSITLRLVRSQWTSSYDPTIEDSYSLTRRVDGQTYHLSLTDTAGQEEYRGMWASSNLRSDAFLLVYDITNRESLEVLEEFNGLIDIEAETRMDAWEREQREQNPKGKGKGKGDRGGGERTGPVKPIKIVAGNKCDLQESRQVPAQVGLEWARKRGCGFMETSARNTVNIEETFALIVRRVVEARRMAVGGGETGLDGGEGGVMSGGHGRSGSGSLGGNQGLGTRRAVTAPLSPLPGGPEKELGFRDSRGEGKVARFKAWWRRLVCWRR
jgi:GTPase KRas protein